MTTELRPGGSESKWNHDPRVKPQETLPSRTGRNVRGKGCILATILVSLSVFMPSWTPAATQPMSLRFLGSDFSLWPDPSHFIPNPNDSNARALLFNPPQGFPTHFSGNTNLTEFWNVVSYPAATN